MIPDHARMSGDECREVLIRDRNKGNHEWCRQGYHRWEFTDSNSNLRFCFRCDIQEPTRNMEHVTND